MAVSTPRRRFPTPPTPVVVARVDAFAAFGDEPDDVSSSRPTPPVADVRAGARVEERSATAPIGSRRAALSELDDPRALPQPGPRDTVFDRGDLGRDDAFLEAATIAREACEPLVNVLSHLLRRRVPTAAVDRVRATLDAFAAVVTLHRRGDASEGAMVEVVRELADVAARLPAIEPGDPRIDAVLSSARRSADDVVRAALRALGDGTAHGLVRGRYRGGDDE